MNCDQLKGSIYNYVEKALTQDERAEFERHLSACPPCKTLVGHVLELPCRDFVQFLDDYYEERLPEEQRRVFEKHMELCPPCIDYLRSYDSTIKLGRLACNGDTVSSEVPEGLIRAILEARKAKDS